MERWDPNDPNSVSRSILLEMDFAPEDYPKQLNTGNKSVATVWHRVPGIFEITSADSETGLSPLVVTGGIHGDEKAGVVIVDRLVHGILTGKIPVNRHVLLMFGNLQAMKEDGFNGVRCIEPEHGELSNLNRCFGRGRFEHPDTYAKRRANQMMAAVECFVESYGVPEVVDIHQSFAVPTLCDVRDGVPDRTEYTYAMLYPMNGELEPTLSWIYEQYSDIVAGAVVNDMSVEHHTFAGYMATAFKAHAATFEQGTIGFIDHNTFTPQLEKNLVRKISGEAKLDETQGFDVWRCVRSITKTSDSFRFYNNVGNVAEEAPMDFVSLHEGVIARDGDEVHELGHAERLLFANPNVPISDRAAAVIERLETDLVPRP